MTSPTHTQKRALVLILDGMGVGELPDVAEKRQQDRGAFTLKHVVEYGDAGRLDFLSQVGFGNIAPTPLARAEKTLMNYGRVHGAHFGADTYWGHQEIAGTKPIEPIQQHVVDLADEFKTALEKAGHSVRFYDGDKSIVIVDEAVVVGDNMEADPGWVVSVTGALDIMPFEKVVEIGRIIRSIAKTSRVNVHGGKYVDLKGLLKGVETRTTRSGLTYTGHNVPKTGIYPSDHFRQVQLGYGVDPATQIPSIMVRNGYPVTLIGKVGDVVVCEGAECHNMVQTDKIIDLTLNALAKQQHGLIMTNIQETDLSGHAQKVDEYFKRLEMVNDALPRFMESLNEGDIFIITADHGNDPTIGHPNHTREYVPLLAYQKGNNETHDLGVRHTLSDVGATVAEYFSVADPQHGTSFLSEIVSYKYAGNNNHNKATVRGV